MKWRQKIFSSSRIHDKNWTLRNMKRKRNRFHKIHSHPSLIQFFSLALILAEAFSPLTHTTLCHHTIYMARYENVNFLSFSLTRFFLSHFDRDDVEKEKSSKRQECHVFYPSRIFFTKRNLKATTTTKKTWSFERNGERLFDRMYCNFFLLS